MFGSFSMRNEKFTGRIHELKSIHRFLAPVTGKRGQISRAVYGLGGISKTQIVKQYFWQHYSSYTMVAWLRAFDVATLEQDFAQISAVSKNRAEVSGNDFAHDKSPPYALPLPFLLPP